MTRFSKDYDKIGVLGLGYVGLPLSLLLARNFRVVGFDSDSKRMDKIIQGKLPMFEPQLDQLISMPEIKENLIFAKENRYLKETKIKIITVGTPYDPETDSIDYSQLRSALELLGHNLSVGDIVILKSTVPPGTTNNLVRRSIEELDYKVPEEIGIAFSPERMVEGQAVKDFLTLPKIVGASDMETMDVACTVIGSLGGKVIRVSSIETAEMVKMVDNYSRFVFLGLTNELALTSEKYGVDVLELLRTARDEYPRNSGLLLPGPGVGGSCLNKDPFILKADAKEKGVVLKMIDSAKAINRSMPIHMVDLVDKFANNRKLVLLAGIAFKGDTDDTRYSPAIEIYEELKRRGYGVVATDPFVVNTNFPISNDIYEASKGVNIMVLLSDHSSYLRLDLKKLKKKMDTNPVIIDSRGIVEKTEATKLGFEYHGLGRI